MQAVNQVYEHRHAATGKVYKKWVDALRGRKTWNGKTLRLPQFPFRTGTQGHPAANPWRVYLAMSALFFSLYFPDNLRQWQR